MTTTPNTFNAQREQAVKEITVRSPAFANMGAIPQKFSADGANVNPVLILDNIPSTAKSMVIMLENPDAPVDTWVHWLVWDVKPSAKIGEGRITGIQGLNSFRENRYIGPGALPGKHNFLFKLYVLDCNLHLPSTSSKYDVVKAMKHHVVGYGDLIGYYHQKEISFSA